MSLNTAHAHGGVLIYAGESILVYSDGVEMGFEGAGMEHFKGSKKGRIYLTTHRVIFTNKDGKDMLQSFSMPFLTLREVQLEQPVFGANYIKGKVIAEEGGNWAGAARFKLWFKSGGAIEFGQAMLRAGQMASRNRPAAQPPPYTPPQGPFYAAPPPAYMPPQTPYYGWVPSNAFPSAPPQDTVYMTSAPPPYPGVDPNMAPYPPAHTNGVNGYGGSTNGVKEQEAAASAYYNPQNPHNIYMPTASAPAYSDLPPPYSEVEKKTK